MPAKIHYHSDCHFFAGCENMLVNFWSAADMREHFEVSFSYRFSRVYAQGLNARANIDFSTYPLFFPELSNFNLLPRKIPSLVRRVMLLVVRAGLNIPLLLYQVWVLSRLFKRLKPDVVHINNGGYPAALSARAAVIAAKLTGIKKIVMVVNNMAMDYQRFSRWWEYPIDRFVARTVTTFVTGSSVAGEQLKKVLKLPNNKLRIIHNGIQLRAVSESVTETRNRLGLSEFDGVILGVVSVMEQRKGHVVLLKALSYLPKNLPFKVLIEGNGILRATLEQCVIDHDLSDTCVFVGLEQNIMNLMALLDVLILPSISHEDFPNVVLEAMALGKPVIASRIAGTPEQIIEGETGILVPPADPIALSAAIEYLIENKIVREQMGAQGKKRFESNFIANIAVEKYRTLYQSMLRE